MDSLIPILFGLTILASLVVTLVFLMRNRRAAKESGLDQVERTEEEKAKDRQTAITWGCLLIAVPLALVLVYTVTR
ncbi:hypothetical protein [Brachybacterium muris]|uniref:Uncharacterized protein n=1 Tax=Brachybacterium muris UCD-AY4 TaxID=1249481 RepID=A0A022KWZ7_9MICO|nr:hypothetical protein [Brachybacterium muris]EYT50396.1 hypothetical protein D641_0103790 [Brachybacterium muris UCD-AY4]